MRTAPCNRIKENDVMNKKTEELEEIIGYYFKNKHYLTQALTHSSYANEKKLGKAEAVMRDWSFWEMLCWS